MNERLKKLRRFLNLTQQQFADRIGSKRNTVAKYETNTNAPSTAVISLICREFNVNEEWLRNGTGDMFLPENRQNEIEKAVKNLLTEETDSFKSRFIEMLTRLSTSDWERLELEAMRLLNLKKEKMFNSADSIESINKQNEFFNIFGELEPALQDYVIKTSRELLETQQKMEAAKKETSDSIEPTSIEERVAKAEEEYIKSDLNLVRKRELLALNSTLDTQNIKQKNTNNSINKNKVI